MNKITLLSPAKINLTLDVLGFDKARKLHQVQTILHKINLYDTITLEKIPEKKIIVQGMTKRAGMTMRQNSAYKAAKLFFDYTTLPKGVKIIIKKRIPVNSGLGGGSSNAATTLKGLCLLFKKKIPQKILQELAEKIGTDVPFFLYNAKTALATNYGEKIKQLPSLENIKVKILKPKKIKKTSTAAMYTKLRKHRSLTGKKTAQTLACIKTIKQKNIGKLLENLHNDFEILYKNIPPKTHLAGSGPYLYKIYKSKAVRPRKARLRVTSSA